MPMRELFAACLLIGCVIPEPRSDFGDDIIRPETYTDWGTWGAIEWCPEGTFPIGFNLKIESDQKAGDDTALNGIELQCQ